MIWSYGTPAATNFLASSAMPRASDDVWFRGSFGPLTTLAGRHEATLDLLLERNRLMHKALDHHKAGEYEASTMLVLSQVDGLTLDFTEGKFGFFWHGNPQHFMTKRRWPGCLISSPRSSVP